jgi:hypothetical protein
MSLNASGKGREEPMTDSEMTKLCAEAMGYVTHETAARWNQFFDTDINEWVTYNPLVNDAQAAAIAKKFKPLMEPMEGDHWHVAGPDHSGAPQIAQQEGWNRAVVTWLAMVHKWNKEHPDYAKPGEGIHTVGEKVKP